VFAVENELEIYIQGRRRFKKKWEREKEEIGKRFSSF
jgi:hypothetical protein